MAFKFRGSNPAVKHDQMYDVPILRYREIAEVPWAALAQNVGRGCRIIIQRNAESLPLDVLYVPRSDPRLLVGFHGLENRQTSDLPKFQFVTSFRRTRKESLLFLSDSTLLCGDDVSIAWMCGDAEVDLAAEYALLIRTLNSATDVRETLLVGHSAGGTAAIRVGLSVPNSRAIAVNSQVSAEYFAPWTLSNLRKAISPESGDNREFLSTFRSRLDLRESLTRRAESSSFTWFTHVDDKASVLDYPNFQELTRFFGMGHDGGVTDHGDAIVPCRWEAGKASSHALPGSVLPFVRAVLGEDPEFDLAILSSAIPEWDRPRRNQLQYRGSDRRIGWDPIYEAPIYRFNSIPEVPWVTFDDSSGSPVRIIIQRSGEDLPLDVLFIPRVSRRLLVGIHGAEPRATSDLPKFQFVRSFTLGRPETLLFLSDSTMLLNDELSISWMVGNHDFDVAKEYAVLIDSLKSALGMDETVLVGHSAGGTAAVRIGTMVQDSHAIAINAQLAAGLYFHWAVTSLRKRVFPQYDTNEEMLASLKDRLDLRIALGSRAKNSRFTWFAHRHDGSSFDANPSFPALVDFYTLPLSGGTTNNGDRLLMCDWHTDQESKHGLPGSVMPFVREALGEDPLFDINIISEDSY